MTGTVPGVFIVSGGWRRFIAAVDFGVARKVVEMCQSLRLGGNENDDDHEKGGDQAQFCVTAGFL